MTITSKIPLIKAYLVDTLLPDVLAPVEAFSGTGVTVFWGIAHGYTDRDSVLVTDAVVEQEFPHYAKTRTIEETGQIVLVIKAYRPTPDGQREATERAFEIHDAIRDHFRSNPNENLGGLVIMASITDTALLEDDESVDEDDLAAGRLAVVTATLTFRGRS